MVRDDDSWTRVNDPSTALAIEYSDKADAYLKHWSPVIAPMALPLLDRLPLAASKWVLDLGAGTGAHLDPIAARASAARILGVDRAVGMLRIARRRAPHSLAAMDAQSLAIQPGTIDVATLIFMLFHIPDPVVALSQVRRTLRAGGTVGVVTWGRDEGMPGLAIWREELNAIGAAPDPRDPIVMQQQRMDTPDKLSSLLRHAGFGVVRTWTHVFEHRWTIDAVVAVQAGCGMAARRIGSLSSSAAAECEARVRQRLAGLDPDLLTYRPEILFATASAGPSAAA
jgi:ubiquinone/menaquinone biosynthesis C-methylase UbiE